MSSQKGKSKVATSQRRKSHWRKKKLTRMTPENILRQAISELRSSKAARQLIASRLGSRRAVDIPPLELLEITQAAIQAAIEEDESTNEKGA